MRRWSLRHRALCSPRFARARWARSLVGFTSWALTASLLQLACGAADLSYSGAGGARSQGEHGRPLSRSESRRLEALLKLAEKLRGLKFRRAVPVEVEDRASITRHLFNDIDRKDLEKARFTYAALGLLPEDIAIEDLLRTILGEQVVGYYDPREGRLVLRDDVLAAVGSGKDHELHEAELVIVHELVHALQDQNLGLGKHHRQERDSDASTAFRAVVEGDATLAMLGYAAMRAGVPLDAFVQRPEMLKVAMQAEGSAKPSELDGAPAILRFTLLAPYVDGVVFAASLHRRGGWRAMDRAHALLPASTEAVLHPDKYFAGERPEAITLPNFESLDRTGLESVHEDTLGELEMAVYFGQSKFNPPIDLLASEGWNGDRLRVYRRRDGRSVALWLSSWDSVQDAIEAEKAAERIRNHDLSLTQDRHQVLRYGRALLIVRGLNSQECTEVRRFAERWAAVLPPKPRTLRPFPL